MSTIFLPAKINVGYQSRKDTYTKKLAYVIYYDAKGKLRKETSWNSWRDKKLGNDEFANEPTEGFVLNKKVGDYTSDWNHRQAYCRVYDPRGWEFEIVVENLLYILENTNCIKGKGLEGKFIYGWEGTELVLIPESAPEYAEHVEFSDMLTNIESIKGKDLVPGGTYRNNKNEDLIYLGRFDRWHETYNRDLDGYYIKKNQGKHYYFRKRELEKSYYGHNNWIVYFELKSLSGRIVKTVSTECVPEYADFMDKLEKYQTYSPHDPEKDRYDKMTAKRIKKNTNVYFIFDGYHMEAHIHEKGDKFVLDSLRRQGENAGWSSTYTPGRSNNYYNCSSVTQSVGKHMEDLGYLYDYSKDQVGFTAQELCDKVGLTYLRKFQANGQEIK